MFKPGMIVEAIRDTQFCKSGEVAEVDVYTDDGEMELVFGNEPVGIPQVYFDFNDFKVLVQNACIAQEFTKPRP